VLAQEVIYLIRTPIKVKYFLNIGVINKINTCKVRQINVLTVIKK